MGDWSHATVGLDSILKSFGDKFLIVVNQITERKAMIIVSIGSQLV